MTTTFYAIFYVDDLYLALRDAEFLQRALGIFVELFARVGLQTNIQKTQTMICTPGRIRTQLAFEPYRWMQHGKFQPPSGMPDRLSVEMWENHAGQLS
jgi:hypothetical protein